MWILAAKLACVASSVESRERPGFRTGCSMQRRGEVGNWPVPPLPLPVSLHSAWIRENTIVAKAPQPSSTMSRENSSMTSVVVRTWVAARQRPYLAFEISPGSERTPPQGCCMRGEWARLGGTRLGARKSGGERVLVRLMACWCGSERLAITSWDGKGIRPSLSIGVIGPVRNSLSISLLR